MSLPCVEIVKGVATDAFRTDQSVIKATVDLLSKTPGVLGMYTGLGLQEPQYLYHVVVWESIQHHKDVIANQPLYEQISNALEAALLPRVYLDHVTFTAEPYSALNAPITEFAIWHLKENTDRDYFQKTLTKLIQGLVLTLPPSSGSHKGGWGPIVEQERQFMVLLGWESLEIFAKTINSLPEAQVLIDELKGLAELDLKHAVMKKHL